MKKYIPLIIGCALSLITLMTGGVMALRGVNPYREVLAIGGILFLALALLTIILLWKDTVKNTEEGHMEMLPHILLTIFTLNIWNVYWYYKTTKYFNKAIPNFNKSPILETILCLFVPYYHLYWTYLAAKNIETIAGEKGRRADVIVPAILIGLFFFWWGDSIYLQFELNRALED